MRSFKIKVKHIIEINSGYTQSEIIKASDIKYLQRILFIFQFGKIFYFSIVWFSKSYSESKCVSIGEELSNLYAFVEF